MAKQAGPGHKRAPKNKRGGRGGALRRSLGLPSLTFYGVGLILGAGIYSIIGAAAAEAGPGLWLAFLLAAAIALLTGLSYAELAALEPEAGAEYTYAKRAFPTRPWLASGMGYLLLAAGLATTATVAVGFGGYLRHFVEVPAWLAALALMAVCAGIAILGLRQSTWFNVAATTLEVGGLVLIIWLAFQHGDVGSAVGLAPPTGLAAAGALVFFAYLGFEDLANLAEEAKDPGRNLPRAILLSVAVSAILYATVGVAALALAPAEALAGSESPLTEAALAAGPVYGTALAALAIAATANTVLITMVALSRMLLALARGGHAPAPVAGITPKRGTPWVATLVVLGGAALFLPLGGLGTLGSVASLATLLAFTAVNVILIRLRLKQPGALRPFRVPGQVRGWPVLPVLAILGALAFGASLGLLPIAVGLGLTAASAVAAWALERWRAGRAGANRPAGQTARGADDADGAGTES